MNYVYKKPFYMGWNSLDESDPACFTVGRVYTRHDYKMDKGVFFLIDDNHNPHYFTDGIDRDGFDFTQHFEEE